MIKHILRVFPFVLLVLFLGKLFFLQGPSVWPDEAIFADIARNIISHGQQSTSLWTGMIPGVEHFASWYPPLFFNLLAIYFRLFGFSIQNQRGLSLLIASMFILCFYAFSYVFTKKSLTNKNFVTVAVLLTLFSLTVDDNFLYSARINRPEVLILLFLTFCLFIFLKFLGKNNPKWQSVNLLAIGLALSFGIMTHFIFTIYLIAIVIFFWRFKLAKQLVSATFLIALFVPIFIWLLSIFGNYQVMIDQINLVVALRAYSPSWLGWVIFGNDLTFSLRFLCYFYIAADYFIWSLRRRNNYLWFLWLLIGLSLFVALAGKMQAYFVLVIPFIYLAGFLRIFESIVSSSKAKWSKIFVLLPILCILFLIYLNSSLLLQNYNKLKGGNYSYERYASEILKHVEKDKTILLSAIPDPYYAFPQGRNKLYEFPVLGISQNSYRRILDDVDFVLLNAPFGPRSTGSFLLLYIRNNAKQIVFLTAPNQYSVYVVELKPKDQRI